MYEIFLKLLEEKGLNSNQVSKATGISTSTFTDWKKGRSKPNQKNMLKIAEYFGVSLDYLMTGKEPEFDKYSAESAHLVAKIRNDAGLTQALDKYFELSDKKKKHVIELINLLSEG